MEIKQLQLLSDIVEAGSISKVSASRGVAQSALSKHVAALEAEFGAKLFYRTGRGVVLTEFGYSIMPRVKTVLGEFKQLNSEIQDRADVPTGPVTIALQTSIMPWIANPICQHVLKNHPNIKLRLLEGFAGGIQEALANGSADVGVFSRYGESILKDEQKLITDELYLITQTGDSTISGPECRFADAAALPLILPGAPDKFRMMLINEAKKAGIHLNTKIDVDSLTAMRALVANGTAYTILTRRAVEDDIQLGRIAISRITHPVLTRTLVLATSSHHPLTQASRTVSKLIQDLARALA